jgi:hypothetical protein
LQSRRIIIPDIVDILLVINIQILTEPGLLDPPAEAFTTFI